MSDEPASRVAPSDEYEASAVAEGQRVRHRDKHVARGAVLALVPMALIALVATIAIALGGEPATGPAGAVIPLAWFLGTVYLGLTRAVVRTAVTDTHVEVHWGPKGLNVPLDAITDITAHEPTKDTIPLGFALWSTNGAVTIRWREQQKERAFMFPAGDPQTLVSHVRAAMRDRPSPSGVRVSAQPDAEPIANAAQSEPEHDAREQARRER